MSTSRQPAIKRPGGRTAEVRSRINQAVLDLIIEGGPDACTFSAVAERAHVERSTLYRRYPDRWELMIEAFLDRAEADVLPDAADNFADGLASVLRKLAAQLESPVGSALITAAGALRSTSGTDYSRGFFDRRMAQLDPMFDAAIRRGELAGTVDREALFTAAAGQIYFRIFIAARGADEHFIQSVVSSVCWLFCSPSVAAKVSLPARLA